MILIKKYANRRLYDTDQSRYITLEELAEKIQKGADVRVADARTNEDLTQATLTQIIVESRGAARLLPVPLLVQLIRLGDDALAEFFGRYMSAALEMYVQARQGAQALAPYNPFALAPFNATSALARLLMGGFGWGAESKAPPSAAAPEEPNPTASPPPPPPNSDVEELRREIEALKRSIRGASERTSRRRK